MNKTALLVTALALLTSCGVNTYTMHIERRYPSKSGYDLAGKSVGVFYKADSDSLFNRRLAEGFATALDKDYYNGEETVGVYSLADGPEWSEADSLRSLVMITGEDVVLVFDKEQRGSQVQVEVSGYDSMGKVDSVRVFKGTAAVKDAESQTEMVRLGERSAANFLSQWKSETVDLMYYDEDKWYTSLGYAEQYKWDKAVDIWLSMLDTKNIEKRSCAEYNLAVAFFIQGDYDLALKWLDKSDKDRKLDRSDVLRWKISAVHTP